MLGSLKVSTYLLSPFRSLPSNTSSEVYKYAEFLARYLLYMEINIF